MPATKGFRLDEELREKFEQFCREHLLDERAVVEAWLLRFLEADDAERRAVGSRYHEWNGSRKQRSRRKTKDEKSD